MLSGMTSAGMRRSLVVLRCCDVVPPCAFVLHSMAKERVHALKGLACRKRVAAASSPAPPASRVRRSRRLRDTLVAAPGLPAHASVTGTV